MANLINKKVIKLVTRITVQHGEYSQWVCNIFLCWLIVIPLQLKKERLTFDQACISRKCIILVSFFWLKPLFFILCQNQNKRMLAFKQDSWNECSKVKLQGKVYIQNLTPGNIFQHSYFFFKAFDQNNLFSFHDLGEEGSVLDDLGSFMLSILWHG